MSEAKGLVVSVSPIVTISDAVLEECPSQLRHLLGAQVTAIIAFMGDGRAISVKGVCLSVTKEFLVIQRVDLLDHPVITLPWSKVMHVEQVPERGQ